MGKGEIVVLANYSLFRQGFREILQYYLGTDYTVVDNDFHDLSKKEKVPEMIIAELIADEHFIDYLFHMKKKGAKIVLLILDSNNLEFVQNMPVDGFLVKNMPTDTLIKALEGILYNNEVYVHPNVGYQFYKRLVANNHTLA